MIIIEEGSSIGRSVPNDNRSRQPCLGFRFCARSHLWVKSGRNNIFRKTSGYRVSDLGLRRACAMSRFAPETDRQVEHEYRSRIGEELVVVPVTGSPRR